MIDNLDRENLWSVASRLRGEAIRHEHDAAESFPDWFKIWQHHGLARKLKSEAESLIKAAKEK